jgi:hypothetical protein
MQKMNFSDLPDNSWEKEMFRVVDFIGGDAPALCNWNDEIPTPQKVVESILTVVAYGDNRDPEKFINLFNEYRQENRYFTESDFKEETND